MSGTTPRFGFNFFGGTVEGSLNDDGQKFAGADRIALDRILAGLEASDGHLKVEPTQPLTPGRPSLTLGTVGELPAGAKFYYKFAFVDVNGLESAAGGEASITTPPPIGPPQAPRVRDSDDSSVTGILGPGLYYYALTALSNATTTPDQSPLGPVAAATLSTETPVVLIDMPFQLPEGAQLFAIWRLGPSEAGFTRIGTALAGETFTDDGSVRANPCACDPGQTPPVTAEAAARYSVEVKVSDDDLFWISATDRVIDRLRLYRAPVAGAYGGTSLVAEVTASAGDPLPSSYIDEGLPLLTGSPATTDTRLNLRPFVLDHAEELPDPLVYPQYYPFMVGETLYAKVGDAWVAVGGGGGGGSSILTAPDGNRWRLTVGVDGTLSTMATPEPGPPTPPREV